jgi:hypothetical protein
VEFVSVQGEARQGDQLAIAELIDWCRFVVQSTVVRSEWEWVETSTGPTRLLRLLFRRENGGAPVAAEIRFAERESSASGSPPLLLAEVSCSAGAAWVRDARRISWRTVDGSADEELSDDRPSALVQLDLFARRLAGGLVPAGTLDDVRIALEIARDSN